MARTGDKIHYGVIPLQCAVLYASLHCLRFVRPAALPHFGNLLKRVITAEHDISGGCARHCIHVGWHWARNQSWIPGRKRMARARRPRCPGTCGTLTGKNTRYKKEDNWAHVSVDKESHAHHNVITSSGRKPGDIVIMNLRLLQSAKCAEYWRTQCDGDWIYTVLGNPMKIR